MAGICELADWYHPPHLERALDAYAGRSKSLAWDIDHKLDLYAAARIAFDDHLPDTERRTAFQTIYDALRGYWQVFRPKAASDCWSPTRIFDELNDRCAQTGARDKILSQFSIPHDWSSVRSCAHVLQSIKPNNAFPTMTVSKFLHFWHPRLIPIYDTAVIWNEVFHKFRPDYRRFCVDERLSWRVEGAEFLANYVAWGSAIVQQADRQWMQIFGDWLSKQAPEQAGRLCPPLTPSELEATAFEFVAIGAATVLETHARVV